MGKKKKRLVLLPSKDFISQTSKNQLFYVFTIISFLFVIYYFTFFILSFEFRFSPPVNKELLNPFVVPVVGTKGLELYILFVGTCIYLTFSYLLMINEKIFTFFKNKIVQIVFLLPVVIKILTTYPKKVADISNDYLMLLTFLVSLGLLIFICYKFPEVFKKVPLSIQPVLILVSLTTFTFFVILTTPTLTGSTTDFNFFIAPALKLAVGEKLGSFYIQYNLGEIFLFKYFLDQEMRLHQMQIVLAVIFSSWFLFYYFLATQIIKERFFIFLFLFSLLLFKFLGSPYHPILSPQASTIRLDLWLPLFLIALRFKIVSPVTSVAFSLAWVLDNFFGLFYFIVYLFALFIFTFFRKLRNKNLQLKTAILIIVPIIAAIIFQYHYFGTFFPQSAKLVDDLDYWQMNISPYSMFWVAILILAIFIYIILKETSKSLRENYLLLLGFTLVGLIYFFGRSHENNLMTTSGILFTILFITFDRLAKLYDLKKILFLLSSFFILIIGLVLSAPIFENLDRAYDHLKRGVLIDINPIDETIDKNQDFLKHYQTKKLYFISGYDAYLNYRYELKQVGYYSPFIANLFMRDTINLIQDLEGDGYVILLEDTTWFQLEKYNESKFSKEAGIRFELSEAPNLGDIKFNRLKIKKI